MRNRNILAFVFALLLIPALLLGACQAAPTTTETPIVTTAAPTPSPTPSPTPTPVPPPPSLLAVDPLAEAFFGPLPVSTVSYMPLVHNQIKAIYIGGGGNLVNNLATARKTEVNAVVIDLKEKDGIFFNCTVPLALEIGAVKAEPFDLAAITAQCHAENVKVIGRIVCFKDDVLTVAKPALSICDAAGTPLKFPDEGGGSFASPYNKDVWQYLIDIAENAIEMGVDEIQFDYVRFPTGSIKGRAVPYFGADGTVPEKVSAINRFLQTATIKISYEHGIPIGADVFGIILTSKSDGKYLGQDWSTVGLTGLDSVSPMIYPSHYANGSTTHYTGNGKGTYLNGVLYDKPDLEPYKVMYNVLLSGKDLTQQPGFAANRPYLQAFTASYLPEGYYQNYGAAEIKAQIKAITDAGFSEWICWNPGAAYSNSAFAAEN